jgi:hypothetical protein
VTLLLPNVREGIEWGATSSALSTAASLLLLTFLPLPTPMAAAPILAMGGGGLCNAYSGARLQCGCAVSVRGFGFA